MFCDDVTEHSVFCLLYCIQYHQEGEVSMIKRFAVVDTALCVACGCCAKVCPKQAIAVPDGIAARVQRERCVGCGLCAKACPASVIQVQGEEIR